MDTPEKPGERLIDFARLRLRTADEGLNLDYTRSCDPDGNPLRRILKEIAARLDAVALPGPNVEEARAMLAELLR